MVLADNIVTIAGLLVVAAGAAELFTRRYLKGTRYFVRVPNSIERLELDYETHPNLPSPISFSCNQYGERSLHQTPSAFHILCAGGSAVECYMLDDLSSWPILLEGKLNAMHGGVASVSNIGRAGVDSVTLEKILRRVVTQEPKPKMCIVMVGASDVLRWMEEGAPSDKTCPSLEVSGCFSFHPEHRFRWTLKALALSEIVRRIRRPRRETRTSALQWYRKARLMRKNAAVVIHDAPPCEHVIGAFQNAMRSIATLLRDNNIEPIFAVQPWCDKEKYTDEELALFWHGGRGKAYRGEVNEYYSVQVINTLMKRISDRTVQLASELDLQAVDLRKSVPNEAPYYMDQFHLTPAGADRVADALTQAVTARLKDSIPH